MPYLWKYPRLFLLSLIIRQYSLHICIFNMAELLWHEFNQAITLNSLGWVLNAHESWMHSVDTMSISITTQNASDGHLNNFHCKTKSETTAPAIIGFETPAYSGTTYKCMTLVLRPSQFEWMMCYHACTLWWFCTGLSKTWLSLTLCMTHNDTVSRNENWGQCTHVTELLEGSI